MKEGSVLAKRFLLKRRLGAGSTAVTWLATDRGSGSDVVLKLLSFGALEDWKALELFEREAGVLRNLHHEGIPAYVDYFRHGQGKDTRFVLVQEYVDGTNCQKKVESGWRGTEEEISRIAARLLDAVSYIHSLRPPIIHRDINPKNVIEREDGAVFLVDFGGVQDAVRLAVSSGATVIGTPGYMPMEQFVGKATVRSDLYGCAATLLFLLTHRNPQDLPTRDMKIDVRAAIELGPALARVLDSWLEPDEARRTLPVDRAIDILEGRASAVERPAAAGQSYLDRFIKAVAPLQKAAAEDDDDDGEASREPPSFSRIRVTRQGSTVRILVPERGLGGGALAIGGFSVFWLGFVAFWTFMTVLMKAWPMPFFSIPFWAVGVYMIRRVLIGIVGKTIFLLDPAKGFQFERRMLFGRKVVTVPFQEVGRLTVVETGTTNHRATTALEMEIGARLFRFGESLSTAEKKWLRRTVNAQVKELGRHGG